MGLAQHTINTIYPVGPVHCYSGELAGELVLFDTGPPTDEARKTLCEQVDLPRLRHVVVTHCHIDHYGLSAWLEQETSATIYLPYRDILKITRHEERLEKLSELLLQLGFQRKFLESFRSVANTDYVFPKHPQNFLAVETELPAHLGLDVMPCPGHSQSDLVLLGANWAVTGDVLLRGIFQAPLLDIDLETGERFRNYDAYCETIEKLASLRGRVILPGHRESISSLDETVLFYIGKLLDRAAPLHRFTSKDSIADITMQLFGSESHAFVHYLKASEIAFMRDFLRSPERLRASLEKAGLFDPVADKFLQTVSGSCI